MSGIAARVKSRDWTRDGSAAPVWQKRMVWNASVDLPGAEGDDSALGIVRRDADRDPIARHDLDAESPHPTAELCQHLVAGVYLHAV